jgi:hypothetical protein
MKTTEIKKLDKQWREAIHKRDEFCQVCHSGPPYLNAHHVIGRRNRSVRWVLDNGILLCSGCHTFKTQSAHQDPLWFAEWFGDEYPERYIKISVLRNITNKQTFEWWKEELGG